MRDQADVLRRMVKGKSSTSPRIIAVTSGKGGVGKTNVSVNLSLSLAKLGYRVALLDADLGLANVDILLGISPRYTLTHVLYEKKTISDIMIDGPYGLKIFAGGSGVYDLANLNEWRIELFVRQMEQLDDHFDFIFIDTGGGISRNVMSFVLAVNEVLVVTTPEPTAITDAYGIIKVIKQKSTSSNISLIVNMVHSSNDGEMVAQRMNTVLRQFLRTEISYAGCVFLDPNVTRSISAQEPFILAYPSSAASKSIERLAQRIVGFTEKTEPERKGIRGFFSKVYNILQS